MLSRRVGLQHVELVEDAVQSALLKALESWTTVGAPADPSAWLYRVAYRDRTPARTYIYIAISITDRYRTAPCFYLNVI